MGDVSVVIPTAGAGVRLTRCLETVLGQHAAPREVVIVSGAFAPRETVRQAGIPVSWLPCPGRPSFPRAVNRGISATTGAWVLVLNDDVVLAPEFLRRLLAGRPADPAVGMLCGKLRAADGRTLDSAGQELSRARTARERGHGALDRGQFDTPGYVFSVPGAAALYRRAMLDEIALGAGRFLDEHLVMYLEDLELGRRAQRAGWRAYYVPAAEATHARGATAKGSAPRWRWLRRYYLPWLRPGLQARVVLNRYRLMAAYDSWPRLLADGPWILWHELRLWSYLLGAAPASAHRLGRVWRLAQRRNILGPPS
jgi:GT2 family glycosyltransferase